MGRLSGTVYHPESEIQHFSHPHPLQHYNHEPQQSSVRVPCSGCKLALSGSIYGCVPCNYFLHISCSKMPQQITHPFDQMGHALILLPTPVYPEGAFGCDACGKQGTGFSYHCEECGIDMHITCAAMPLVVTHHAHVHNLDLIYVPPYNEKRFSCDLCKNAGSNHWLYRCSTCEFDVHLDCATIKPRDPVARLPIQAPMIPQRQIVSRSVAPPPPQYYQNPGPQFGARPPPQYYPLNNENYPPNNPNFQQSRPNFTQNNPQYGSVRPNGQGGMTTTLVNQAAQGLVNGVSQAIGQNLVQGLLGGGGGSGGGGGQNFIQGILGGGSTGGGGGGCMVVDNGGGGGEYTVLDESAGGGGGYTVLDESGGGYTVLDESGGGYGMEGSVVDTQDYNC